MSERGQHGLFGVTVSDAGELVPDRLRSLWDMLQNYLPIYKIAVELQRLRRTAEIYKDEHRRVESAAASSFQSLLQDMQRECLALGLISSHEMASRRLEKAPPNTYDVMFGDLDHLDGALTTDLTKEAVFRIPPERKGYFERTDLFGPEVTAAFPSSTRDIQKAGSCYAIEQEDACVHHLMMVLERGLKALAKTVGLSPYHHSSWQTLITNDQNEDIAGRSPTYFLS